MFHGLFYCILVRAFCWLKYGICPYLSMTEILAMCVNLKYLNDSSPSCGTSLPCSQNPLLSVSDHDPVHTFINSIISMPRSQKFSFLLSPTEFFMLFLPPFTATQRSFGEDSETMNYAISYTFPIPHLYLGASIVQCPLTLFFP